MRHLIEDAIELFMGNERVNHYKQIAAKLRYIYAKRENLKNLPYELNEFSIFKNKKSKYIKNELIKENRKLGLRITIFDLMNINPAKTKKHLTVARIHSAHFKHYNFSIRPTTGLDKFWNKFSKGSTLFMGYPDIEKYYHFKYDNKEDFTTKLSDEDLLDFLMYNPGFFIEAKKQYIVIHKKKLLEPEEIVELAKVAELFGKELLEIYTKK